MATTTSTVSGDIPAFLEPFYIGEKGLIPRAIDQIFPTDEKGTPLTGAAAFDERYKALIDAGLIGEGEIVTTSPYQKELEKRLQGLQMPSEFGLGKTAAEDAVGGLKSLLDLQALGVAAPNLTQFQMGAAPQISNIPQATTSGISGATTGYDPLLQQYQLGPAQTFGAEQAQQYMSPYMQQVVDAQQRQAIEAARKAQLGQNLAAARQGTYGGARQALLQGERESGLRTQLGDIQARGLQDAYSQAQQQFERDRAAQMGIGQQNLASLLQTQQLGTQTGLQTALANLSNEQQARVQSEANRLQASGMNQQAALQTALANQQAGLTVGQQNLAAALGVQQLGAGQSLEAQRANQAAALQAGQTRLGAAQGLGGLAQTLGGLGTQRLAGELDISKTIGAYGDLQRALDQQALDAKRQAEMQRAEYGQTQVGQLSNLLRGIPMTDTTQRTTTPPPSFASQLTGMGLTGVGLYNLMQGGK